jgi:hypothetical protein
MNSLSSRSRLYLPLIKPLGYAVACIACVPLVILGQAVGLGCMSAIGRSVTMSGDDVTRMEKWVALGFCGVGILGGLLAIWLMRKADRTFGASVQHVDAPHPVIRELAVIVIVAATMVGKLVGPALVFIYGLLAMVLLYVLFK